jgi:hypothetical protein
MRSRGIYILIIIIFLGIFLKEPFLITLPVAILVIGGIAWWWQKRALNGVQYFRKFYYTRLGP